MKEYAIGEVFERDGVMLEVVRSIAYSKCIGCVLLSSYCADLKCSGEIRKDGEDVILKHAD